MESEEFEDSLFMEWIQINLMSSMSKPKDSFSTIQSARLNIHLESSEFFFEFKRNNYTVELGKLSKTEH
jgi:hypothetical protein